MFTETNDLIGSYANGNFMIKFEPIGARSSKPRKSDITWDTIFNRDMVALTQFSDNREGKICVYVQAVRKDP